jgi:ketosteroid isomerase-like protein
MGSARAGGIPRVLLFLHGDRGTLEHMGNMWEGVMTLKEIAEALVSGCREGREGENLDKLYSVDAVSVESDPSSESGTLKGIDAIKGKHAWWEANMEMLDGSVDGPFLHGDDKFAVVFGMKAKDRNSGDVIEMTEVAIYTVADGKIVHEAFFYNM